MKKLAVIPARGGSKRIPRKNIRPFLGRPIIAYSIEAAQRSGLFDEVMVSTEDEEIAAIARSCGASVPFRRSRETAGDSTPTVDVLLEVIGAYRKRGQDFRYGCCLYPTAPLVTTDRLAEGFRLLLDKKYWTVFPVLPFSSPVQRALRVGREGRVEMFYPQFMHARSQDLEKGYYDSGQFYWFDTDRLSASGKLWTENSGVIILSPLEAHDIDTEEDWQIATLKYKLRHGG